MVVLEDRAKLRQGLASFVGGTSTDGEFLEVYCEACRSKDGAVRAIAEFGFGHCSEDRFFSYRLTGSDALSPSERAIADRCLRFLETEQEYEWPEYPDSTSFGCLAGLAIWLGIPLGIVLCILSLIGLSDRDWSFLTGMFLAGAIALALSVAIQWGHNWECERNLNAFWAAGEKEAWPFLRREDIPIFEGVTDDPARAG